MDSLLFPITGFYAALLGLLLVALSARVVTIRGKKKIAFGDGSDQELLRAIRVQGNFVEYVPIALILIGIVEVNEAPRWAVHGLGQALLLGRMAHIYSIHADALRVRVAAMTATWGVIVVAALWNAGRFLGFF
jgi:uncharacterized membrane protein YecN with MAPEG domain